jgi:hypothetical protein
MQLLWRVFNSLRDALSGAPEPLAMAVELAFPVGLLLLWALTLKWRPRFALLLNLAMLLVVALELLAYHRAPAPPEPGPAAPLAAAIFWGGELLIALLGVIGTLASAVRLHEDRGARVTASALPPDRR